MFNFNIPRYEKVVGDEIADRESDDSGDDN